MIRPLLLAMVFAFTSGCGGGSSSPPEKPKDPAKVTVPEKGTVPSPPTPDRD